jgi:hypothetical protein
VLYSSAVEHRFLAKGDPVPIPVEIGSQTALAPGGGRGKAWMKHLII